MTTDWLILQNTKENLHDVLLKCSIHSGCCIKCEQCTESVGVKGKLFSAQTVH
jgi:hypothetical protein